MEMKDVFQNDLGFLRRWLFQIDPKKQIRIGQKRWHQEHGNVLRMQPPLRRKSKRPNHAGTAWLNCREKGKAPFTRCSFYRSARADIQRLSNRAGVRRPLSP